MLRFEKVSKIYPSNHPNYPATAALDDISFEIKEKEFISIVGKSGAGKTTLLKLILAEEKPTKGKIIFNNQDIGKIETRHLSDLRRKIGAVFQDYKLLSSKTAYENIAYVLEVIGATEKEIQRDVPEVLKLVGLADKANNFPTELSGGERQRVAIARALIHRPEIILADEPTGNLDPYNTLEIIRLLLTINDLGTIVVLSTHNREVINRLEKRVITLENGKLIRDEEGGRFIL